MGQRSHAFKIQLGSLGHFKGQTKNILTVLFCWMNSLYIFLHIHYRIVHVFAQIRNGSCQWFTFKIEKGRNEQWVEKGILPECSGYQIGKTKCWLPFSKKLMHLRYLLLFSTKWKEWFWKESSTFLYIQTQILYWHFPSKVNKYLNQWTFTTILVHWM